MTTTNDTLFSIFRPFSPIYSGLMKGREYLYKTNKVESKKYHVPVISIGNLTMGGTGKTPMVIFLAELFRKKNFKPAIISRGYKGTADKSVNIVSDYQNIYLDAAAAGDEPFMMATKLSGIPVLTGKKRHNPCTYAIKELGCDVLLLDDGFQHLHVQRDLDLVLFNSSSLTDNLKVFPGGELREPLSALNRASALIFTNYQDKYSEQINSFITNLKEHGIEKPVFKASLGDINLFEVTEGWKFSQVSRCDYSVLAFSGIANPNRFKEFLLHHKVVVEAFTQFADHHKYTQQAIDKLIEFATKNKISALITTEKDIVKLKEFQFTLPLFIASPILSFEKEGVEFILENVNKFYLDES